MLGRKQFALKLIFVATVIISTAFAPTAAYALSSAPLAQGVEPQEGESTHPESAKEASPQDPCTQNPTAVGCGDSGANVSTSDPRQVCPDTFRKYEERKKKTGNPQAWRGCEANYPPAKEFAGLSVLREGHDDGTRVYGIAWTSHGEETKTFYVGLNVQAMDSPRLTYLEPDQNSRLWSLYFFLGQSYPAPISPYVEVGGDLRDLVGSLLHEALVTALHSEVDCKTEYCPTIDAYIAIGIQNQPKRNTPLLRGYAKWYSVGPNQRIVYVPVVGVSLGWLF